MAMKPEAVESVLSIRPEAPSDIGEVNTVVGTAFSLAEHSAPPVEPDGPPGEVTLLEWLRVDEGWLPDLALVTMLNGHVVGQVVCTRAHVDDAPALGLGPLAVHPEHQSRGVGTALMHDVLARAERAGETIVALLGNPAYYGRFGFVPARELGLSSPGAGYGDYFQARSLRSEEHPRGCFRYAAPFNRL